ncbi:MAG: Ig-like domain-containing protein [Paludibacteraceae bacterium]|nr:Ig-like domain-containing protein [Paludibacteraceae bacterium]
MKRYLSIVCLALVLIGCANRGIGPQGGPKDTIPPIPLRSEPENGALEFQGRKIEVTFNEYLQLDNIAQNLIMSPPQQRTPDVKVRGKHLVVQLEDTLKENTTYTLDFGNAVCDFTEKNPFPNYLFAFSTGPVIDTLEIMGRIYDAETLNPVSGITVGIQSNLDDSAFTTLPFERIARSDSVGAFRISNMKEGSYRLYAVEDISKDFRLTVGEPLAFADSLVIPEVHPHFEVDSLGNDSLIGYDYGPADLQLWLFTQTMPRLYLARTVREKQHMIQLLFSSAPDSLPTLRPMRPSENDSTKTDEGWIDPTPYIYTTYSVHGDTVTMWLTDSLAISQDTLYLEARYRRTDSLYQLEWTTDTLRAFWRAPRMSAKALKLQQKRNANRRLEIKSNARSGFELYDTLRITCSTPLAEIIADSIHLAERIDTILKPVPFTLAPFDTLPLQLTLIAPLKAEKKYELKIDSAAFHDIYGVPNNKQNYSIQMKTPEDYSTLRVKLNPYLPKARIQVLNPSDKVLRELPAAPDGAFFQYLKPDTYYLRLYIDENEDGLWTTGSWDEHRQPEPIYYFPDKLQTKSNWDFEEEWDYLAVPQTESKPKELIKAAPKKR